MLKKGEIKKGILENCVDKYGHIDLSGLDFSDFDRNVYISYGRVKGDLIQNNHKVNGNLDQDNQKVKGNLDQYGNKVLGNLRQSGQFVAYSLSQTNQGVGKDLIQDCEKCEGKEK